MASINYAQREITCKVVYYGCAMCGKTTNLEYIHQHIPASDKGGLVSLSTQGDRTLFFDFLPLEAQNVGGFTAKFQLYTVPGQVVYNATRRLVLRGVDGVVFVADAQWSRIKDNVASFENMIENLSQYGPAVQQAGPRQHRSRTLPGLHAQSPGATATDNRVDRDARPGSLR
jgi:signal recognition particle receptor subunit beta